MRRSGDLQYGMEAVSMLASSLPLSLSPAMAECGTRESSGARLRPVQVWCPWITDPVKTLLEALDLNFLDLGHKEC